MDGSLATGCRLYKPFANSTFLENIGMKVVEKIHYAHMSQVNSLNPEATLSQQLSSAHFGRGKLLT